MRALTLKQPWADAVCYLGKRLENRTRPPPRTLPATELIAIHAGMADSQKDHQATAHLAARALKWGLGDVMPEVTTLGAVVAVCRVVGWLDNSPFSPMRRWVDGMNTINHLECLSDHLEDQIERWFDGPFAWVLEDVQVLAEPVPARGALGLWALPDDVERAVRAQEFPEP